MDSTTSQARELRRNSTDAERRLWVQLRDHKIGGYRFRRQRPLGRFIVDFIRLDASLVIEVDGNQHASRTAYDTARTRWIEARGYRVLRFSNREVLQEMQSVTQAIWNALQQNPHPNPPPRAGEGEELKHAQ